VPPATKKAKKLLPTRALCERYDIVDRTVDRWVAQGILPAPTIINNRRYWPEDEIERRERAGMRPTSERAAACSRPKPPVRVSSSWRDRLLEEWQTADSEERERLLQIYKDKIDKLSSQERERLMEDLATLR
jgi:predicted site-specific integrase-resolvase